MDLTSHQLSRYLALLEEKFIFKGFWFDFAWEDITIIFDITATKKSYNIILCQNKMAKRGLSRKEPEEIKKREEIEAAAEVINNF